MALSTHADPRPHTRRATSFITRATAVDTRGCSARTRQLYLGDQSRLTRPTHPAAPPGQQSNRRVSSQKNPHEKKSNRRAPSPLRACASQHTHSHAAPSTIWPPTTLPGARSSTKEPLRTLHAVAHLAPLPLRWSHAGSDLGWPDPAAMHLRRPSAAGCSSCTWKYIHHIF